MVVPFVARRPVGWIALCCLLAQVSACTSTRYVPVDTILTEQQSKVSQPPGLSIVGYVTKDGVRHPFDGTVTLENDVFVLHPGAKAVAKAEADTSATARTQREPLRIPRAEIESFNSYQSSHTILIIGICAAMAAGFVWLGESLGGN